MDPLQDDLLARHAIEVPVISWPAFPKRLLRVSAQLYNDRAQYQLLAAALRERFG
jgi:isopenicillin-N epimerase